jgi:hypothetical protein
LLSVAIGVACLMGTVSAPGSAHVVYDRRTLRQWSAQADLIVVAEIRSPLQVWQAADRSDLQEFFSLQVLETISGPAVHGALDVFPHAEGEPRYRVGDRAVLFLDRTAERREFAHLAGRFPFFTTQGAGHEWRLGESPDVVDAVRRWLVLRDGDMEGTRAALLAELRSDDTRLRADALLDLTHLSARTGMFPSVESVEPFARLARSDRLDLSSRLALARALDGAPGFSGADVLLEWTTAPDSVRDEINLIRVGGSFRDPRVTAWLEGRLADERVEIRAAAALALGEPWHASSVPALQGAAADPDDGVARAAVRGLEGIGSADALAALDRLAASEREEIAKLARAARDRSVRRRSGSSGQGVTDARR